MSTPSFRILSANNPADIRAVQALHFAAPGYSLVVYGHLPDGSEASDTFSSLPPGKALNDKVLIGVFSEEVLIGCAEILRGYPEPNIAFIGLLLFSEAHQGRGLGRKALDQISAVAASWGCTLIQLTVIATNRRAHAFWSREGFSEVRRKWVPGVIGEGIVMQRDNRLAP